MIVAPTTSTKDESYSGTTVNLSHVSKGGVLMLGSNQDSVAGVITGIIFNGVAFTKQSGVTVTGASGQRNELWYLNNAPKGTYDIIITYTNTGGFASVRGINYPGVKLVDTTAGTYDNDNQCQSCSSLATSVTTDVDNCWTVLVARSDGTMTAGSGTTYRGAGAYGFFDSGALITPAGSNTLNVNKTSASYHSHIMVSLVPETEGNIGSIELVRATPKYLKVADTSALDITPDISLEALVNVATAPSGQSYEIATKWDNSSSQNQRSYRFVYEENSGHKLHFYISSDGTAANTDDLVVTIGDLFGTDKWARVGVTWDGSTSTAKFYVNGVQVGSDQVGTETTIFNSDAPFCIGSVNDDAGGVNGWDGMIDDVRMWDDVRTAQEMADNAFTELVGDEANLIGYWKLNDTLLDETTSNLDLTNVGSAVFVPDTMFLGTTEILRPNAAGDECNINNQVGASCPNHYQNVDESIGDDGTTSVYHNTDSTSARDLYALDNSSGSGDINKIIVGIRGEGTTGWFKSAIKEGGTTTESDQLASPADDTFETKFIEYSQNPDTNADWTWVEIDALQAGCVSYRDPAQIGRVTQIFVIVDYTAAAAAAGNSNFLMFM